MADSIRCNHCFGLCRIDTDQFGTVITCWLCGRESGLTTPVLPYVKPTQIKETGAKLASVGPGKRRGRMGAPEVVPFDYKFKEVS